MNQLKNIAIVDDHTMFRKGLVVLINLFPNHKVTLDAANGNDFIRQLDVTQLPDILLLDIAMPVMDGYTLCTWVTANHPSIRTLALSTMDTEVAILRMIRAGARGYLHKDAEPSELKTAFEEVMSYGYYYNEDVSRKILQSTVAKTGVEAASAVSLLSDNELTFLKMACSEKTYYEIAKEMFVSVRTVDGYRDSLFKKLHVSSRVGLSLFAVRAGIVIL